jgi:hypothetical protein
MEGDPTYEEEKNEFRFKVFSFHGYKKLNKAEEWDFIFVLRVEILLVEKTGVPGENHQPAASH